MKVIDLLNKIANGEIPKIIVYDEKYFTYDDIRKNYFAYDDSEIDWKYTIMEYINDEIEVIEEPKKIEKLETIYKIEQDMNLDSVIAWQKVNNKIFQKKIDEIIDYINKENK